MALFSTDEVLNSVTLETLEQDDFVEPEGPSTGQVAGAAFRQENIIGSGLTINKYLEDPTAESGLRRVDPEFDREGYLRSIGRLDALELTAFANSEQEIDELVAFKDKQIEDRQILEESGVHGMMWAAIAGIADPTILIPGGAGVKAATKSARILKGSAQGSLGVAAGIAAQEGGLQATQSERTIEESAIAVTAGAFLGGAIGAGVQVLSKPTKIAAQELVEDIISPKYSFELTSEGAIKASSSKKQDEGLAAVNETLARVVTGGDFMRSPSIRALTSQFATVREVGNGLFQHGFVVGKNIGGREVTPAPVETLIKLDMNQVVKLNKSFREAYVEYAGGVRSDQFTTALTGVKAKSAGKMGPDEFNKEIGRAIWAGGEHKIPQVARIAKEMIEIKAKPFKRMKELGIIDESLELKGDLGHLGRAYDSDKIVQNRTKFENMLIEKWLRPANPNMSLDELRKIADETTDNILRIGESSLGISDLVDLSARSSSKFTKARVIDIPSEELEEFLIVDPMGEIGSFMQQASGMIRTTEWLQAHGFNSLQDLRKQMRTDLDTEIVKQTAGLSEDAAGKVSKKLTNQFKKDIELVNDAFAMMRGNFGIRTFGDEGFRTLRKYQVQRLLGGVTLSSIPDLGMSPFQFGVGRTLIDGYLPMLRDFGAAKLTKDQHKDFAIGLELETNDVLRSLSDPEFDILTKKSKFTKAVDMSNEVFSRLSLISHWNNFHKRVAGQVAGATIIRHALAKGPLKKVDIEDLAAAGISKDDLHRIKQQFDKYGQRKGGSFISNHDKWKDREIAEKFGQAMLRLVDNTILTPAKGDIPVLFGKSELGKTLTQFKSFPSTATNKIFLKGIEKLGRRPARALQGLVLLQLFGMMSYISKTKAAGREPDYSFDNLLVEGFTRSGTGGLMADVIFGLNPFGTGASRYAQSSALGLVGGPSVGLIKDFYSFTGELQDGELNEEDTKKLIKLLPAQNLFYSRIFLEQALETE